MKKISNKKFGSYIKKKREEKGVSRDELAAKLFITNSAVWNWETGKRYPDLETLGNLASELGISVQDIYDNSVDDGDSKSVAGIITVVLLCLGLMGAGIYHLLVKNGHGKSDVGIETTTEAYTETSEAQTTETAISTTEAIELDCLMPELGEYRNDFYLASEGFLFEDNKYTEPKHGESTVKIVYSLGGIGRVQPVSVAMDAKIEEGKLVDYEMISNHAGRERVESFSGDTYSGVLYLYSHDLFTHPESIEHPDDKQTQNHWVIFLKYNDYEDIYIAFYNADYYSKEFALNDILSRDIRQMFLQINTKALLYMILNYPLNDIVMHDFSTNYFEIMNNKYDVFREFMTREDRGQVVYECFMSAELEPKEDRTYSREEEEMAYNKEGDICLMEALLADNEVYDMLNEEQRTACVKRVNQLMKDRQSGKYICGQHFSYFYSYIREQVYFEKGSRWYDELKDDRQFSKGLMSNMDNLRDYVLVPEE